MRDASDLLHHHHHGPAFIRDTPVMRDFIADVQAAIAHHAGRKESARATDWHT